MPLVTRAAGASELKLPPPYEPLRLREYGDAFAHAIAVAPKRGAGTLVHVGRFDLAEFAVVLEPKDPLAKARRAFYAGMAALADTIAAAAPPETAIHMAWPAKMEANKIPDWLVFGSMIRTANKTTVDPGLTPNLTALDEEGFAEITSNHVIESFARNLMLLLNDWQESGFAAVSKAYCERLSPENGKNWHIDDNGDLISLNANRQMERKALLPRLAKPAWLDVLGGDM